MGQNDFVPDHGTIYIRGPCCAARRFRPGISNLEANGSARFSCTRGGRRGTPSAGTPGCTRHGPSASTPPWWSGRVEPVELDAGVLDGELLADGGALLVAGGLPGG